MGIASMDCDLEHVDRIKEGTYIADLHIIIFFAKLYDGFLTFIVDSKVASSSYPLEGIHAQIYDDISKMIDM